MFRYLRALILAVLVAASLLGNAAVANANTTSVKGQLTSPPARPLDITWQ